MGQKESIQQLLSQHGAMTQGELAESIYGDKFHGPNIYSALMSLVRKGEVLRSGSNPAKYSLSAERENRKPDGILPVQERARCYKEMISEERAVQLILDYYNETKRDAHGRYLSWQHCYGAFSENRYVTDEETLDYLALHLAFYLASWGMYRGSSFLLQKDYKIHIPVVEILQEKRYGALHGISAENLCKNENLDLLDEIGTRIRACYAKEVPSFEGVINNATDTLVTKILLGTLGCVPAYDRYYVQAVKKNHISSGNYNRSSVCAVARFYCGHLDAFEKVRRQLSACGVEYPPMKLMDMCFWQDAYMDDIKRNEQQ